ncbi:hypothetical protein EVAR_23766_1 [Eumeta japonica]|uniref:Reverse transcriptase domain-containing protein n=1 Tax=Eumeta variegata TaxID=151549 RepID=A0A4C1VFS2_EUMVA|nr:hypothetical protein EVAR_23766_1 [Eumeta japonica]
MVSLLIGKPVSIEIDYDSSSDLNSNHGTTLHVGYRRRQLVRISKGRSNLDAITLVVNTAREAIAGTRWKGGIKKYCLVATLDIRNAFNSANWE